MPLFFRHLLALAAVGLGQAACQSSGTKPETDRFALPEPDASGLPGGLKPGPWHGELLAQGQRIPFAFDVATAGDGKATVYLVNKGLNGTERLRCDDISAAGDSATIRLHVFDAALVVRADGEGKLTGTWVKYDAKTPYRVPLVATRGAATEEEADAPETFASFTGTWRVIFRDETGQTYPAVGVFQADSSGWQYTGTFLTTTGDYRYLTGYAAGRVLRLSTFDGSHAYLFSGVTDTVGTGDAYLQQPPTYIKGDFYSGKAGHETWTATRDPTARLPDADGLTALKPGQQRLTFRFPSAVAGGTLSPTDAKYRGKVVVVQLLGSWCPNCLDETTFLAPWYEKNKGRGVEVIGLGYERSPAYDVAAARLRLLRERLHIGYDLAVAGVANKDSAARSLPQLQQVLAFPTTIFLDKKGVVRQIHTGFAGPGTGRYYEQEIAGFEQTVNQLLKE